jgi:3-methylcrotonyl-CoA carboxylase alpha subunit
MNKQKIKKLLIANRGEIACKIIQRAKKLNIPTLAIYSDLDIDSLHTKLADEAIHIQGFLVSETYMNGNLIIQIAKKNKANAIHPGYGLLSENADFIENVEKNKLIFIGPNSNVVRNMGEKDKAKTLMEKAGLPVVPGYHGDKQELNFLKNKADEIGFPLLVKARSGGGGRGMRIAENKNHFSIAFQEASNEAKTNFNDSNCILEKYIPKARHIEIQIFADKFGNVVHLFDRDCSLQRRQQKVIEEAPSPNLNKEIQNFLGELSVKAARAINYLGAGTIEFIADIQNGLDKNKIYFMEMNTRIQVEHPVTEAITSTNLIDWQLNIANGEKLPVSQNDININGWAFEARLYAEDVNKNFLPQSGKIYHLKFPDNLNHPNCTIETGTKSGDSITPFYDPMIAKIIAHGNNRNAAIKHLINYLYEIEIAGITTNLDLLIKLLNNKNVKDGEVTTKFIEENIKSLIDNEIDDSFKALVGVVVFKKLKIISTNTLYDLYMWKPNVYPLKISIKEKEVLYKIVCSRPNEIEIEFNKKIFLFSSIIINQSKIEASLKGENINLSFQSMKDINSGDQIFTFFTKQHTFKAINRNLLQSKDNHISNLEDSIIAPMHGIVKIKKIKANSIVKKGDVLFILEAMKMEFSLTSPRDGIIERIFIINGQQVSDKMKLLSLKK